MYQLKYIAFLLKIFGVISTENLTKRALKTYMIFFSILTVLMLGFDIYGRYIVDFPITSKSLIFVGTLNMIALAIHSLFTTLSFMTKKKKKFLDMLSKIDQFDIIIYKYVDKKHNATRAYSSIIILHIYYIISIYTAFYLQKTYHFTKSYQYGVFDDILRYRQAIFLIFVYILLQEIRDRIISITDILKDAVRYYSSSKTTTNETLTYFEEKVDDLTKAFAIHSEIMDLFNDIFGWTLLIIYFNFLCLFLISFKTSWTSSLLYPGSMDAFIYIWFICLMLTAVV